MGMDKLQMCLAVYDAMLKSRYRLTLEGGIVLNFFFAPSNLSHLLGLHKLKDLQGLTHLSGGRIYKMLQSGELTYPMLHRSKFYNHIANRIEYFHLLPMMPQGKVIVDFDVTKVGDTELINTRYILYQNRPEGVVHLTLGEKTTNAGLIQYPETFFFDSRKRYIDGQNLLDIEKLEITHI